MPETKFFSQDVTLSARSEPASATFPAKLAYWTFGDSKNPAVLLPTCFGGKLETTLPFLYDEKHAKEPVLSPEKYFIIVTGLLGGGESSSPINAPAPWSGPDFPHTTYEDNIRLQHALCTHLCVEKLFAYIGFSMGGQQAYHMATLFPKFVENVVCLAGSARTSWHNWSFLEGPRYALVSARDFEGGRYGEKGGEARLARRAFSRVYSTWALSPEWFRERCWEELGFQSLQAYLDAYWDGEGSDANGLLALLWTWQHGDITVYHPEDKGDLGKALERIEARVLVFPVRTDQYFPPEDSEAEVKYLKKGELRVVETPWGHVAGGGSGRKADTEVIVKEVKRFLGI